MSIDVKWLFPRWRISARALWIIGIGLLLLGFAFFVYLGYHFRWKWTGFPPKRLFDWIQILVIPFAVAIGTFVLNRAAKRRDDMSQVEQNKREEAIETKRAEEASLQSYLDYMSRMLTDPERPLRRSYMGDHLSVVARAQTLIVLGRLEDGARKRSIVEFLYEAGLISRNNPVINLQGADLKEANFHQAILQGANLLQANLQRANLLQANLKEALLQEADFQDANLFQANLQEARLQRANFFGATLWIANLKAAQLQQANLQARLSGANLAYAYLEGANLPRTTLINANLAHARLQEANLPQANLQGADLAYANLNGANLQRADLKGAVGLTQDQIEQANGDEDTTLPEGIDRPKSWSIRTDDPPEEG